MEALASADSQREALVEPLLSAVSVREWQEIQENAAEGEPLIQDAIPCPRACDNSGVRSRFLPVLSLFAGGLAYALLPRGTFATHDVVIRAVMTGAVAAAAALLLTLAKPANDAPT